MREIRSYGSVGVPAGNRRHYPERPRSEAQTAVRCSAIDTPIKALVGLCYHREQSGGECYEHSPRYELY